MHQSSTARGHDSEFGLMRDGMIVSALDAFDEEVFTSPEGRYFADNMNCEIAIEPVNTLAEFHSHTEALLSKVRDHGYELIMKPVIKYPDAAMDHPLARISGCNPDFSPYFMRNNIAPDFDQLDSTRSLGAHIHATLNMGVNPHWWARWMDIFVTLPLLAHEEKSTRRDMYGKAGCMREKTYGGEYRALSNVWLDDPNLREFVWHGTQRAVDHADIDPEEIDAWWDIPQAIDTHDLDLARKCIDRLYAYGVHTL